MRILLVTHHFPYPPVSGAALRIYNLLYRISKKHEVWLISATNHPEDKCALKHLSELCTNVDAIETHPTGALSRPNDALRYIMAGNPPELRLYQSKQFADRMKYAVAKADFDLVNIEDSFMGLYLEDLPMRLHKKTVLTFQDVIFNKYQKIAGIEPRFTRKLRAWIYSITMRRWEPYYAERFGRCVTVSESDRRLLLTANPRLHIDVVPNGVDTDLYKPLPPHDQNPNLVFVGNMAYRPNIDAMAYFCLQILPRIRKEIPNIVLWIVGIDPGAEVKQLDGENVHVTGSVEDVRPYYDRSTVCVVPLRAGGGTRLKIMESMALGRPVVSTSIGCEGLDVVDGEHLFVADTADRFAENTIRLLKDQELRQRIAANARELVATRYSWDVIASSVLSIYEQVAYE